MGRCLDDSLLGLDDCLTLDYSLLTLYNRLTLYYSLTLDYSLRLSLHYRLWGGLHNRLTSLRLHDGGLDAYSLHWHVGLDELSLNKPRGAWGERYAGLYAALHLAGLDCLVALRGADD